MVMSDTTTMTEGRRCQGSRITTRTVPDEVEGQFVEFRREHGQCATGGATERTRLATIRAINRNDQRQALEASQG